MRVEEELRTYLQVLWRHKWMIAACAIIASMVALGISLSTHTALLGNGDPARGFGTRRSDRLRLHFLAHSVKQYLCRNRDQRYQPG